VEGPPVGAINTLKRLVGGSDAGEYVCQGCGRRYSVRYYSCPQCGSYSVERPTEWSLE